MNDINTPATETAMIEDFRLQLITVNGLAAGLMVSADYFKKEIEKHGLDNDLSILSVAKNLCDVVAEEVINTSNDDLLFMQYSNMVSGFTDEQIKAFYWAKIGYQDRLATLFVPHTAAHFFRDMIAMAFAIYSLHSPATDSDVGESWFPFDRTTANQAAI
ncbi:hypothetical protein [Brucella grignonensis]|uniref:Uncharacterized protein n=1 Tax=Brucella grignonensis TaxID=94627 RepID=A0A256F7Q9_9HYPH|nr:hypothetical protein [Brucella grignonensis]OYR10736.1 hypothetical protein CEV33_2201 [Brucella grignonensis]